MPRIRRARLTRLGWEIVGVVVAGSWALVAIAHALSGAKRALLLDDGDSVLLPLMVQSAERGEAVEWGMSPVLFVFPELPLYVASAAVTTTVAASLLVNGVVNVVLLYGLLRFVAGRAVAGRVGRDRAAANRAPARSVLAALLGVAAFTVACLLETRQGGNTGEIASLYLTTTYYSGTVMALVAAVGLAMHTTAVDSARRILVATIALGLLSALATLSNPLFVLWAAAPLALSLSVIVALRLRVGAWRRPVLACLVLVGGAGAGYLARQPLGRFVIADKNEYFRWGGQQVSVTFFRDAALGLVETPGGIVEAVLALALLATAVIAAVVRLRRGHTDATTLAALLVCATVVVVPVGLFATGSISTRYALPLVFAPVIALVALAATSRLPAAVRPFPATRRRLVSIAVVAALVVTVVAVVPAGSRVATASRSTGDPGAACLADWSRGKNVTGVAQFWQGRGLAAYGGDSVHLLQVNSDLSVYPWLVNLAAYRRARVSYVIVATGEIAGGHTEYWGDTVTDLGTPVDIVHCGTFDIDDFRGTAAERTLSERVDQSADVQAALRGFGW